MFRRLLAVLAVTLLAASCSSSDTLATVNGAEITKADLYAFNPEFETSPTSFTGEQMREAVSNLVVLEAAAQAAEKQYGVSLTEADITDRLANYPQRYAEWLSPSSESDPNVRHLLATASLLIDHVGPTVMAEELGGFEGVLADRPEIVTQACVRYIAVATEEEADEVLARLNGGEDFVALVQEVSIDPTFTDGLVVDDTGDCFVHFTGGTEDFVEAITTADLNVPVGPVNTGAGYAVIVVEDRVMPASATELAANPMDYIELGTARTYYASWASDMARDAEIEINPEVGKGWSSAGFGIVPPGE